MDFPSFEDLQRIARDEALSRNEHLTLEVADREGTEVNVLLAAGAAVGDEAVGQLTRVEAALFLDSAEERVLDRLVFDRYNITRNPASQALGTVKLSTTAPAPGTFAVPRGTRFSTSDGREFIAWAEASFSAGSTGPVYVQVRSVLSGRDQQAAIGTITSLLSQLAGSPADLVVTNDVATAGANDEESDASLRDRARRFFVTARRATVGAIEAAALLVPGVLTATAFEVLDALGRPARTLQLAVSDRFTDALVAQGIDPPTYNAQSQVLADSVFAALAEWRAAGIYVRVYVAQVVLQPITLGLRFLAGVDVDLVAYRARARVVSAVNELAPGEALDPADLVRVLAGVQGLDTDADNGGGSEVLSPAGIVEAAPLQVLRTTIAFVVPTSVQPDRVLQASANPDSGAGA